MARTERISLAQGSGGEPMQRLLRELIWPVFANPILARQEDQARLAFELQPGEQLAFTTDSFVVTPLQFPGGDIGSLAVQGTLNDLAVGGAVARYLSCGLIIEEGLPVALLRDLCLSLAKTARDAGVQVVTGDTKVVPRGAADGLFINTSGLGIIPAGINIGTHRLAAGDSLVVSGPIGEHGAAILASRQELAITGDLRSDCANLSPLIQTLLPNAGLHALRDMTRGGLNAVLHEFAEAAGATAVIDESAVPVRPAVQGLCELLGLDPLQLACEGRLLAVVAPDHAEHLLQCLQAHPMGQGAAIIGRLTPKRNVPVILNGLYGIERALPPVSGELLPRIC
ncbi:hydrogenase expression/formation protein HypE [Marinobacterium rhizophilum]|uniref:Hydrogenase expression/formation protein HypE n=1 Tax=Marinobacterium rhizophilum TaxID=420402 RepID=A0ABY5HHK9_9GAMM|nr:hydrogenase expression/formation protein HypE [Marinobacterium rhizophilum]UTW11619.1 hydrogenase expression/formation protein HypE [Marinobacterium rhizophilum]